MAGANGMSSKSGPAKPKSQLNVVRLYRGKGERVTFAIDKATGRGTMANSKGEMKAIGAAEGRQRIANLTSAAGGFKVRAGGGGGGPQLAKEAPRVATLNRPEGTRYQVAGSGKLYRSKDSAIKVANKAAKVRANAKVATIPTEKGPRYQVPGSYKLYRSKKSAQRVAGEKAAEQFLTGT